MKTMVESAARGSLGSLVELMARLRGPQGCPWDREQTHISLRRHLLEEAYEAVAAINAGDPEHLKDELGDVLLQVVFHAQLASEAGLFDITDVIEAVVTKMIRRHPHIFAGATAPDALAVEHHWEAIKLQEQQQAGGADAGAAQSILRRVGHGLPALLSAAKVTAAAAKIGFDWPDVAGAFTKVDEELAELRAAPTDGKEEELGDLLFSVVNVSRFLGLDPEVALTAAVQKFKKRFGSIEAEARRRGCRLSELSLAEMDAIWNAAKENHLL